MKGVIVAAGYGTRFLPLTKTMPKEMLPMGNRPIIDFILDEFEEAGITECVILTSRRKKILDDYLDKEIELEAVLQNDGKKDLYESIKPRNINFIFVRQNEMKGTGHAILTAASALDEGPFIVAYPDDIVISSPGLTKRMVGLYEETGKNILAVRKETDNLSRYGVIKPRKEGGLTFVEKIIEKPAAGLAPSNFISIGRYIFTWEFLIKLRELYREHKKGEFYHVDAVQSLAENNKVLALEVEGLSLDTGEPFSYFRSLLEYFRYNSLTREILNEFVRKNYL